jgi:PAS domain S-box-containing protein
MATFPLRRFFGPAGARLRDAGGAVRHAPERMAPFFASLRRRMTFSGVVGAVVALVGLVVLIGWGFDVPRLTHLRAGWPPTVPNAALGLLLSGLSLFLLAAEDAAPSARYAARAFALLTVLLGLVVLGQYLYRVDLGIDRLLFNGGTMRGRMAPGDALELLLVGLALLLVDTETNAGRRPTEFLALVVGALALPTLVSFTFGALPRPATMTSLLLAAAFCLLACGLLFARPRRGLTAILTGPSIGGVAARRLLPLLIVIPVVLGGVFVSLQQAGLIDARWIAPLFASSVVATLAAVGTVTALSFHRSDAERRRAERRLYAQHAATRALTELPTANEAIPVILASFADSLGWDLGVLWQVDRAAQTVRATHLWHRAGLDVSSFEARTRELVYRRGVGMAGRVWMTGEPAWVPDLPRYPSFRATQAERHGLHAGFAFPIRYMNEVTGVMEFFSREQRQPDGDIVAMAGVLGGQVGDAIERKRAEEQLRVSEERFRAVAETASDALVSVDAVGHVTYFNPAAAALFGIAEAEALGRPVAELLPDMRLDGERLPSALETRARRADGSELLVEISLAAWRSAEGASFKTAILRDISARKRNEDVVRRARDAAEASNRELEAFSYSVSHDLRKPLRGIEGFSRALLEEAGDRLDERGRDYAARVVGAAERMSTLIDDLLELSRATSAKLHIAEVDLSLLAHEVAAELQRREPQRRVEFAIKDGLSVSGDPALLRAALDNLIGNAWKFTARHAHGRIEVGARCGSDGAQVFFVRDDGAGFDPAYAQDLFRPFERLHRESEFPGTGVGLAIVQRIVRRHGGRVWAEGEPEKGATFSFTVGESRSESS